ALFSFSRPQAELHRRFAAPNARVVEIGFMLGDRLIERARSARDRRTELRELGLVEDLPVVLYAPSWYFRPELIAMNEPMLDALWNQREFNVIIKPHPNLLRPERCGGKNWRAILDSLRDRHVLILDDPDEPIYELMTVADALLSDISSVVYEFLFLDRPIVVHRHDRLLQAIEGQPYLDQIRNAVLQVQDPDGMIAALEEALRIPSRQSEGRRRLVTERFFNVGTATDHAVRWIYREVGLTGDSAPPGAGDSHARIVSR
ncbi:MAG TPA: hypothetical protein ENJ50_04375, partial [Planctomycetaceae bacterium]|nr:hypothetical protein [Planctomycetaceae bacterium]